MQKPTVEQIADYAATLYKGFDLATTRTETEEVGAVSMPPSKSLLSAAEYSVVSRLADAWNEFVRIESLHPDETTEFRQAIHAGQQIIMARPVQRQFNADNKITEDKKCRNLQ